MVTCHACGSRVDEGAHFCGSCGAYLDWSEDAATDAATRTTAAGDAAATTPPATTPSATTDAVTTAAAPRAAAPRAADTQTSASAVPGTTTTPERSGSPVTEVAALARTGRRLAVAHARTDLADRLDAVEARLADRLLPVAVIGEFKRGKSTLVNALLQTSVCPVDADIVTAVPTIVRYGEQPGAVALREDDRPGGEPVPEPVDLAALADVVSESGNPGNRRRLRSVEVRLRHRLLRSGLSLVDTPGVGGLRSAHGVVTLGALDRAEGLLFVTDASQELTAPELEFLRTAVERCPTAACVLTKTDLHAEWRRIADLDRAHLARAGLDLPVIPVSSFLRLRAAADPELLEESGFRALASFLATAVVTPAGQRVADVASREVAFVAEQLAAPVHAERRVVTRPPEAAEVVSRLRSAEQRAARLTGPAASWQQALSDGVQDLVADVEHLLQQRLREVAAESEGVIDQSDPRDSWPEASAWLQREVALAVVATQDELRRRADELADTVSGQFRLEAAEPITAAIPGFSARIRDVAVPDGSAFMSQTGRLTIYLAAARTASVPTMLLYGLGGALLAPLSLASLLVPAAPFVAALGAGIGGKVIRDERRRQQVHRQQQAKQAVRHYLDQVAFVVGKDCRDSLRATQRVLRDEFAARAGAVHRSTVASLESAARAAAIGPEERAARARELADEARELSALQERLGVAGAAREVPGRA